MKKMQINKLSILLLFLLARLTVSADIAIQKPQKPQNLQDTKYYFANVDSFATHTFYVKKSVNNKTYKLKQDAAFLIKVNGAAENEELEVWAVNKSNQQKTNSFILTAVKPTEPVRSSTNYIAITFYFDKAGKLNHKQTVLKPDCYSKKQFIPLLSFKNPTSGFGALSFLSFFSFLVLLSTFLIGKMKQRNIYV